MRSRKQINAVFEARLPEIAGAVNKMAHFDDDLKQEALAWSLQSVTTGSRFFL
jgi:hypothetical protein